MNMFQTLLGLSLLFGYSAAQCYNYDVDIGSVDLNNGINNKFLTVEECQTFCTTVATSAYFSWTSTTFSDPNYHYTCWCSPDNSNQSPSVGSVSGPNYCGDPNTCCSRIQVASTGSITTSPQAQVLGTYAVHSLNANGHQNYVQENVLVPDYMYYHAPTQLWMIGSTIGVNSAYATTTGGATCAEQIQTNWDFWQAATQSWVLDGTMTTYCI